MGSQLNRVDIIPSEDWSVAGVGSGRLVWATPIDGGLIATYWESSDQPDDGYVTVIRTGVLPSQHSVVGFPPGTILPYNPEAAGLPGAYPYINADLVLWVCRLAPVPDYAFEGVTPSVVFPINKDLTPPSGE